LEELQLELDNEEENIKIKQSLLRNINLYHDSNSGDTKNR